MANETPINFVKLKGVNARENIKVKYVRIDKITNAKNFLIKSNTAFLFLSGPFLKKPGSKIFFNTF